MSEIKHPAHLSEEVNPLEKLESSWNKYGKQASYALIIVILALAGYFAYKNFVSAPNEAKASESMFRAEEYFRMDSLHLALNGDNVNPGFLKIISKYGGTKSAKLAGFYAGACYLELGDFNNAVKYLKDYSTSAEQVQVRAFGLLGDAYSELNKKDEAVEQYKKAGTFSEKDELFSPKYLFRAGYLYESMGKTKEAIEMYQLVKDKYPGSQEGYEIDKYLARLGVTK